MQSVEIEALIKNVDGVDSHSMDMLKEAFDPQGMSKVARSPNFTFIVSHAIKGRTAQQVSELLEVERREYIPPSIIRDYIVAYVPPQIIARHVALRSLSRRATLEPVEVLQDLLALQYDRVAVRAETVEVDDEAKETSRREIDLCRNLAKDLASVRSSALGLVPDGIPHPTVYNDHRQQAVIINGESAELDTRSAARVVKVIEEVSGATPEVWDAAFTELEQEEAGSASGPTPDRTDQDALAVIRAFGAQPGQGDSVGKPEG